MSDLQQLYQQAGKAFQTGHFSDAEHHCRKLLRYNGKHSDVLHLLALSLQNQHQVKAAATHLNNALKYQPLHHPSRKTLISLYTENGQFDLAQKHCQILLGQQSQNPDAYFLVAKLYRSMGLTERALKALLTARQALPEPSPLIDYLLACVYYDMDEHQQTEAILQNLVRQLPEYIDAHIALNKLYWEHGPDDKFLTSLQDALAQHPDSRPLHHSLCAHLLMAGRPEDCEQACEQTLSKFPDGAEFFHLRGSALCRLQRSDEALRCYQRAVELQPDVLRHRIDYGTSLLRSGDFKAALAQYLAVEKMHPDSQEMLAYKALCLHALGDPEAEQLNNYNDFVQIIALEPPAHYPSREAFMAELADTLQGLHKTQQQPLDQSVRNGTQTVGNLLAQQAPVIGEFKTMLEHAAKTYLAKLPDDARHPLLRRKTNGVRFTGAWSVRLSENGFHSNHVHPEGWVSCCTYIQLPAQVRADDDSRAGWIKFGDSGLELPGTEIPQHAVCPQVGYCVFFPSYFFHGTVPFQGEGVRMTAPCDISPAW
ncbi:tetratricopeptide repeat protein [Pseudidiomarina sp. 1APP75-32.1]|uniref:Tetratricopeptide repeat protein n=1 Tax=Pseudidiomarina terrestris TaxID=2820060 RepID=A0AAW7QZY8_9GAMM|nr:MULTISPECIES: tetratricopeptide repeat protein [unclassified Pseudidiomarina]MDN7124598.1 tetratricopeptide repeat protein [Pseudidiomarina sp. 1APP75-32.1]MDN7126856.1 tetratricopeptide repeat protein [Pseudidiomarina sp. 1APR75-33.1]MDN7129111.1 tetratricopeptide repeat protein [Pseudidiomarina sp. 1APR75-15]MDN7136705.1 tetratricopeptide repeat protein [Pseudidiomarina sp. 1ASP75-14]